METSIVKYECLDGKWTCLLDGCGDISSFILEVLDQLIFDLFDSADHHRRRPSILEDELRVAPVVSKSFKGAYT